MDNLVDYTKKRRMVMDQLPTTSKESINERLLKLEEDLINIHTQLEDLTKEKRKHPRKNTLFRFGCKIEYHIGYFSESCRLGMTNQDEKDTRKQRRDELEWFCRDLVVTISGILL